MENIIKFTVDENDDPKKLREYLRRSAKLSGRLIKGAAMDGRIKVNNNIAKLNYILKCGDVVTLDISKEETQDIQPEDIDIEIVYEDIDVIVVNKSPGMVVHPTKKYQSHTLANALLYYFEKTNQSAIVRLVSRLDMDTSGLILIAKNQFSHMSLARDMHSEDFRKNYLAVVHGHLEDKSGTIDLPIYRQTGDDIRRIVDDRGQQSITHFNVIESLKGGELVELTLETGRTHQIRVHMSQMGHPLYGDSLYGKMEDEYIERQALHAYKLSFPHPKSGKVINLEVGLPNDMKDLIKKIR